MGRMAYLPVGLPVCFTVWHGLCSGTTGHGSLVGCRTRRRQRLAPSTAHPALSGGLVVGTGDPRQKGSKEMKYELGDVDKARWLLDELKPGDTVYTILRHVSSSGMSRWIDCVTIEDNEPKTISWAVGRLVGRSVYTRNHDGVECIGAGMDMGFDLVYTLSMALFGDGYALKQRWL